VLCGELFGVPVMGTHAHSWIMSFDSEFEAFKAYADLYPNGCTLLVDTYDTIKSGVPNAIKTFDYMKEKGLPIDHIGIRLDSGDLAYLTKKARKMLDEAGYPNAKICASNDLDEYLIDSLLTQGAAIDSWGVGTNLITSKDNPAFGGVYKLAAVMNEDGTFSPKIKVSENSEKVTNPGNKKIYRVYDKEHHKVQADIICFEDETFSENEDLVLFDPLEPWKKTKYRAGEFELRELMVQLFCKGRSVYTSDPTMKIREYCLKEQDTLWDESRRLVNPHQMYVDLSDRLYEVKRKLLEEVAEENL
jgi:nicotinate phosphoribosyltransferase